MLRGRAFALTLLGGLTAFGAALAEPALGPQGAAAVAIQFGAALQSKDAAKLRPLLPRACKVRMRLVRFGPEEGSFSAGQVEALFEDFLRQGAVRSFDVVRTEIGDERYALVRSTAQLIDRNGAAVEVGLHLTFQPEAGRWVLREIRETPP